VDGPTEDPAIEALRNRQAKNFLAATLLALGTPMLLMGDEVRRTQRGNNNAYCQDNEISWFDWSQVQKHADVHRFVQHLIVGRLNRDLSAKDPRWTLDEVLRRVTVEWHGVHLQQPDWSDASHCISVTIRSLTKRIVTHLMMNAYWESLEFEIPPVDVPGQDGWRRWIDTSLPSPDDISDWRVGEVMRDRAYSVQPRSVVVLIAGSSAIPA
jgi:glycogen operon protein